MKSIIPTVYDGRPCQLGEGPLWHPLRDQLFWFDILGKKLLSRKAGVEFEWAFDEFVSAAGWVDLNCLLIASETGLVLFDVESDERSLVVELERDVSATRTNDCCTDPFGGFWISTMGKSGEAGMGSIYRYFDDEVRQLYRALTIPNAICFAVDGRTAYFTDTPNRNLMVQELCRAGWPIGKPRSLVDLSGENGFPDGATVDSAGHIWVAMWGGGGLLEISPHGNVLNRLEAPVWQPTCPAFGGTNLDALFFTSAEIGLESSEEGNGSVFSLSTSVMGVADPAVRLKF